MIDDDLVVRACSDRSAFAALYDRYYPRILRYCLRRLYVRQAAEDATSEVFLQIASHLPSFAGTTETDFRRWLFRIATNAVNAQLRQTRRRRGLWEAAACSGLLPASDRAAPTPAADMLDWPALYQAVLELEPRDQAVVTLRFFADLPHDEIADIVGTSAGAVRTALSRILSRLRARFGVDKTATNLPEGQP
jgi:RNA polymerase sigma-70 factor (ECF subfamily)